MSTKQDVQLKQQMHAITNYKLQLENQALHSKILLEGIQAFEALKNLDFEESSEFKREQFRKEAAEVAMALMTGLHNIYVPRPAQVANAPVAQ